ncbi:9777_t:CDS:1, partial [Gigaspora margarita]
SLIPSSLHKPIKPEDLRNSIKEMLFASINFIRSLRKLPWLNERETLTRVLQENG